MRIAVATFPNSKMGGILTVHDNLVAGLRDNGHDVTDYYLSDNTSRVTARRTQDGAAEYCGGRALGIRAPFVADAVRELSRYDAVVYDSPAPALNRSFDDPSWKSIHSGLRAAGVRQAAVWHDPFWQDYYPWVADVAEYIDVVAAIQPKACRSLPPGLEKKAFVCNHPLSVQGAGEHAAAKEDLAVCPHQFKSWKRIDLVVRAAPAALAAGVRLEVFNVGIEYYYMAGSVAKRKPRYRYPDGRWIWDAAVAAGMDYRGPVARAELERAFRRQKCTVDMSVGELGSKMPENYRSVNYSVLECMKYGGVPVVRYRSVQPPFTKDSFLVCDESDVPASCAALMTEAVRGWGSAALRRVRSANRDVLIANYRASVVARSITDRL